MTKVTTVGRGTSRRSLSPCRARLQRTTLALTTSTGGGGEPVVASADGAAAEAIVDEAASASRYKERHVDMLLLLAKCSFPALFVAVGGAVAIPANKGFLTESMRTATEEMAGGALLVTYAFELTKGYTLTHPPVGSAPRSSRGRLPARSSPHLSGRSFIHSWDWLQ